MAAPSLLYATQVAPYREGPAGVHGVLDQSATAMAQLAEATGLAYHRVTDVRALDPTALEAARVVALFTIGETPWSAAQRRALIQGTRRGRLSVLAVHSATDSCYGWEDYGQLVGARFDGHPWTQDFAVDVVEPEHPATEHLGGQLSWHDEVYLFKDLRPDAQILLALADDQVDLSAPGGRVPACGFPLAWCIEDGVARSFYTALGHFHLAWELPIYLRHLAGGLAWLEERA
jgi:uncharacterized protein